MSRFCSNCGAELNEHDNFCSRCGKEVTVSKTLSETQPPELSLCKKVFTSKGRLNRLPYFKYSIALALLTILLWIIGVALIFSLKEYKVLSIGLGFLLVIILVALCIAQIMLAIRRLHDLNFSGWWYLAYFLLIGMGTTMENIGSKEDNSSLLTFSLVCDVLVTIATLVLIFKRGTVGCNKYGTDPLETQNQR